MKTSLFLSLALLMGSLHGAIVEKTEGPPRKIVMFSVPKAGTHLILKALELITGRRVEWIAHSTWANPSVQEEKLDPNDRSIVIHHLFSSFDFIKNDTSGNFIKIIQIRDPRDVLLSQIKWMGVCDWCWYAPASYMRQFNQKSFDEKLTTTILFPEEYFSVRFFLQKAKEWKKEPGVLVSRFEDLVGPHGGGDSATQHRALRELAEHVGYTLDEEDVERIADQLFGGTRTFMKGQIGTWREKFSPEHIVLMKEVMGQELMDFGYETSLDW